MKHQVLLHVLAAACLGACLAHAQAQTADVGNVQRAIEDQSLPKRPPPTAPPPVMVDRKPLERLVEVQVEGRVLSAEVKAYWQPWIGGPVSGEQLLAFETWVADQGRRGSFLVYAQTEVQAARGGGQRLKVQVVAPRVKSVATLLAEASVGEAYEARVKDRLAAVLRPGELIDMQAVEEHLSAASYDLPVELGLVLRPAGPELVDMLVEITPRRAKPGDVKVSAWQVNNYGLRQYGEPQVMGSVTLAGVASGDEINLLGLGSAGVVYARAEYDALTPSLRGRTRAWGSTSKTHTIKGGAAATVGDASEFGLGFSHYLPLDWRHPVKSQYSISRRMTSSALAGSHLSISDIRDSQLRWTLSSESMPRAWTPFRVDLNLAVGDYTKVEGDITPLGGYKFVQGSAKYEHPLGGDEAWRVEYRLRGQWASRNLDSYNRMSLGGVNGVRAYTTADGVGDSGAQWSIDLVRRVSGTQSVGVFYDGGVIRPNQNAVTGSLNSSYTLNAVGVSWNGSVGSWLFTSSLAKGFGGYKKAEVKEPTESRANETRVFVSATYYF
ncbi:ShlB/FhaC/HecB family hemolysin secretion/activation protein [Roseateles sp.]|uniref:ShlB/FhaC/HecB family hemolysin secretion/activation protein n=1 Tax=Roseateles sp. TaxID=1971397 RepID=UPI003BA62B30